MGNKIVDKIVKPMPDMNSRNAEEVVIPLQKGEEMNQIKASIMKWNISNIKNLNY